MQDLSERQPFCVSIELAAADATKDIVAAPGALKTIVVTHWVFYSKTAAAQVMSLGDGTVFVGRMEASILAGRVVDGGNLFKGVALTKNTKLTLTPASAGPAGTLVCEGYIANAI